MGLPHYLAIDRKPDNGCEIQTSCCGVSGVMLQLKVVKTLKELDAIERQQDNALDKEEKKMQNGTKVSVELVKAWSHSNQIVCGDSFFASVNTAEKVLCLHDDSQ
jgi:hypothetical protein